MVRGLQWWQQGRRLRAGIAILWLCAAQTLVAAVEEAEVLLAAVLPSSRVTYTRGDGVATAS